MNTIPVSSPLAASLTKVADAGTLAPIEALTGRLGTDLVAALADSTVVELSDSGQFFSTLSVLQTTLADLQGSPSNLASIPGDAATLASLPGATQNLVDALNQIQSDTFTNLPVAADALASGSLSELFTQAIDQQAASAPSEQGTAANALAQIGIDFQPLALAPASSTIQFDAQVFQAALETEQTQTVSLLSQAAQSLSDSASVLFAPPDSSVSSASAVPSAGILQQQASLPTIAPEAETPTAAILAATRDAQRASEDLALRDAFAAEQNALAAVQAADTATALERSTTRFDTLPAIVATPAPANNPIATALSAIADVAPEPLITSAPAVSPSAAAPVAANQIPTADATASQQLAALATSTAVHNAIVPDPAIAAAIAAYRLGELRSSPFSNNAQVPSRDIVDAVTAVTPVLPADPLPSTA